MEKIKGRFPTVPEYFQEQINSEVNLIESPKQCCPFHKENTPSFSYNVVTGRWSCFGACHAHGDVVEMHRRFYKLDSREDALRSLRSLYDVKEERTLEALANKEILISEEKICDDVVFIRACNMARTPERWLKLDYAMSVYPYDRTRLEELIQTWERE